MLRYEGMPVIRVKKPQFWAKLAAQIARKGTEVKMDLTGGMGALPSVLLGLLSTM